MKHLLTIGVLLACCTLAHAQPGDIGARRSLSGLEQVGVRAPARFTRQVEEQLKGGGVVVRGGAAWLVLEPTSRGLRLTLYQAASLERLPHVRLSVETWQAELAGRPTPRLAWRLVAMFVGDWRLVNRAEEDGDDLLLVSKRNTRRGR